jgi:hypothetical protein
MAVDPSLLEGAQIAGAGGFGGAVRAFLSVDMSMRDSVITTVFGSVFAYYFAPIAVAMFIDNPSSGTIPAFGFIIGLIGLSIAKVFLKLNYRDIVLRFLPQGK